MKLNELRSGDVVNVGIDIPCIKHGRQVVKNDHDGLYLECSDGKHYLDGQQGPDGHLVGIDKG